jgi:hypothetical protein
MVAAAGPMSATREMALAGLLALVSGVACHFMFDPESGIAWLLGIPFAIAACIAASIAWRSDRIRLASAAIVIALAWVLAYLAVQDAMDPIDKALHFMSDGPTREQLGFALAFNVGSLVGGGITILGLGLASGRFIAARYWLLTLAIGAAVVFVAIYVVAGEQANQAMFLFLFPAWQIGILLSVLWGTRRMKASRTRSGLRPVARP